MRRAVPRAKPIMSSKYLDAESDIVLITTVVAIARPESPVDRWASPDFYLNRSICR